MRVYARVRVGYTCATAIARSRMLRLIANRREGGIEGGSGVSRGTGFRRSSISQAIG